MLSFEDSFSWPEGSPVLCPGLGSWGCCPAPSFEFTRLPGTRVLASISHLCFCNWYSVSLRDQIFYFWLRLSEKQLSAWWKFRLEKEKIQTGLKRNNTIFIDLSKWKQHQCRLVPSFHLCCNLCLSSATFLFCFDGHLFGVTSPC